MEGFLTFVFFFVLIVWLIGRFLPFLLTWWIKRKFGKMGHDKQKYATGQDPRYKEGEVIVEIESQEKKMVDNNVGEYIDYEETTKS